MRRVDRRATAVGVTLAVLVASSAPRLVLYGAAAVPSSALRASVVLVEIGLLAAFAGAWPHDPVRALRRATGFTLAVGAVAAWAQLRVEAAAPGSMFPPVLYRRPPSLPLSVVMLVTESLLWVALWTLVYVFPRTLDAARRNAEHADQSRKALELSRLRARVEPARLQLAIAAIGARLVDDPAGARAQIAELAEELDGRPRADDRVEPASRDGERPTPIAPLAALGVPTPTLRDARARSRFVVAVVIVALIVALGVLARVAEHGTRALPLELLGAARVAVEIVAFALIAEHASRRGRPVLHTVAAGLGASVLVGFAAALAKARIEAAWPGSIFPAVVFTHPTPLARQLAQVLGSAPVHVGLWTLLHLLPLARDEADRRAALAATLARDAELARLRATLTPHFVRNALNVVAGLVTADPDEARRLLRRLGTLLLDLSRDEERHPLADEVAWLGAYADLLEARHPGALSVRFAIDPRAEPTILPRLLLQPLVENAVIHGALAREAGGQVRVTATVTTAAEGRRVRIAIEDDGPGLPASPREGGLGVRLVRDRLAAHGAGGRLDFESTPQGTCAIVELPAGACP